MIETGENDTRSLGSVRLPVVRESMASLPEKSFARDFRGPEHRFNLTRTLRLRPLNPIERSRSRKSEIRSEFRDSESKKWTWNLYHFRRRVETTVRQHSRFKLVRFHKTLNMSKFFEHTDTSRRPRDRRGGGSRKRDPQTVGQGTRSHSTFPTLHNSV